MHKGATSRSSTSSAFCGIRCAEPIFSSTSLVQRNVGRILGARFGSLLKRGNISVESDLFYNHTHAEPHTEYLLLEGWYHDTMRADFEAFFGRMGQPYPPASVAAWLFSRTTRYYVQGVRCALTKRELLTARHFMLRSRACGWATKEGVEYVGKEVDGRNAGGVRSAEGRLIPKSTPSYSRPSPAWDTCREQFAAIAPRYSLMDISEEAFRRREPRSNRPLVTVNYKSLEFRCDGGF